MMCMGADDGAQSVLVATRNTVTSLRRCHFAAMDLRQRVALFAIRTIEAAFVTFM